MIKTLQKSLEIDIAYSVNSFIYILKRLPIFNDLLTEDAYSSKTLKKIIGIFGIVFSSLRAILLKFFYYFAIFYISYDFFKDSLIKSFFHIYFFLTILGIFINNKLLNTSKKKYFSIILFNMDATNYFKSLILYIQITNLILNGICIFLFMNIINSPSILYGLVLLILPFATRLIGETLNIMFYKKYNYIWYSNSSLYFSILITLLLLTSLPFINIYIPFYLITIITIILLLISIPCLLYLNNIKDYKLIYKKLSIITKVMDSKNDKDYLKQAMVEVKEKDKKIDSKILENKKGYDLFNTIFFERHKEILLRSAKKYSLVLIGIYIFLSYLVYTKTNYKTSINELLTNNISWLVIAMFIINRGAIITQAMFLNCDHAMLNYNFYREEKIILNLFKKRLLTVIKVNLIPAIVVGIGNILVFIISKNINVNVMIFQFIYVLTLSVLFSVHYLVIYYLLQPFNKDLEVKKASYSFVTMITYIVSYWIAGVKLHTVYMSIFTLLFTIVYIVVSMVLIRKYAPKTFKLN